MPALTGRPRPPLQSALKTPAASGSLAAHEAPAPYLPMLETPEAGAKLLRVFFRIAAEWSLTAGEEQVLLGIGKTTLFAWKAGKVRAGLDAHVLERLSYLLRIYAALEILLPVPERAVAWLRKPNAAPLFGGGTALQRMLGGQVGDLMVVASYLDAQRGGDFS